MFTRGHPRVALLSVEIFHTGSFFATVDQCAAYIQYLVEFRKLYKRTYSRPGNITVVSPW